MQLDAKQKVLCAFYAEYQKDLPNMDQINALELDMPEDIFVMSCKKLRDEVLIDDIHLIWEGDQNIPVKAVLNLARLSRQGIDYVEKFFNINPLLPGQAKVEILNKHFAEISLTELVLFTSKILLEMDK